MKNLLKSPFKLVHDVSIDIEAKSFMAFCQMFEFFPVLSDVLFLKIKWPIRFSKVPVVYSYKSFRPLVKGKHTSLHRVSMSFLDFAQCILS